MIYQMMPLCFFDYLKIASNSINTLSIYQVFIKK